MKQMLGKIPLLEVAARATHAANRELELALLEPVSPPWDEAPDWQRDSALRGALQIMEDPTTTPEQSHQNWLAQKEAEGWTYGEVKDAEAKTHPCFLPYADLPEEQRLKDALFGAVVRAVAGLG